MIQNENDSNNLREEQMHLYTYEQLFVKPIDG